MLTTKFKWRADRGASALETLSEIEASILALHDEDLLDLHDIFAENATSALGEACLTRNCAPESHVIGRLPTTCCRLAVTLDSLPGSVAHMDKPKHDKSGPNKTYNHP